MIECPERCNECIWLSADERWRIQLHCQEETLACLKAEWDALLPASDADQFFAQHAWQQLWWRHFGHDYVFRVLTVRNRSGKLAGIAPLMASRFNPNDTLSLIGGTEIADYLDFIVEREHAEVLRHLLLDAMREHLDWRQLDLHGIREQSSTVAAVQAAYAPLGIGVAVEQEDVSPTVGLQGSWEAYLAGLSKKARHELRRKLRRAVDDQGGTWLVSTTGETLERNVEAFLGLHRLSSAEKAQFMTPRMESYFRDLAAMTLEHGTLRLGVLWVGETPVSAAMGFAYKGRLYLYNSGYDPAYAAHSVGIAAVGLMLKDSAHEGLEIFDFLQGNEPYKYTLGAHDHGVFRVLCTRGTDE
jgi:CelD/BcsL family acetyltransferase involved in cellulose biosynthesis